MKNSNLLNLMLAILLCMATTNAKAQLEVKVDPIDLLFNSPKASAEYIVNDEIGIELMMGFKFGNRIIDGSFNDGRKHNGYSVRAVGKYYFNSKTTADRWYAGLYAGSKSTTRFYEGERFNQDKESAVTAGITLGYKWHGKTGIVFEVASGIGRAFSTSSSDYTSPVDGFGRVTVGYRF